MTDHVGRPVAVPRRAGDEFSWHTEHRHARDVRYDGGAELSPFDMLASLLERWKLVVGLPIVVAVLAAGFVLLLPQRYEAEVTFSAELNSAASAGALGGLANLAGQLGVSGFGSASPAEFYAAVLESRELLTATLRSPFPAGDSSAFSGRAPLLDLLEVDGESEDERTNNGVRKLRERIQSSVSRKTDIVTLRVELSDPRLAASVANRMVELLGEFNLHRLQSHSREHRRFTEDRLREAERALSEAEARHLAFLTENRSIAASPVLQFERQRLERQLNLRQELFLTLSRRYEEARIAEAQDVPVLTVVDSAVAPTERSFPRRGMLVLLCFAIGVSASVASAFGAMYLGEVRRDQPESYERFRSAVYTLRAAVHRRASGASSAR